MSREERLALPATRCKRDKASGIKSRLHQPEKYGSPKSPWCLEPSWKGGIF